MTSAFFEACESTSLLIPPEYHSAIDSASRSAVDISEVPMPFTMQPFSARCRVTERPINPLAPVTMAHFGKRDWSGFISAEGDMRNFQSIHVLGEGHGGKGLIWKSLFVLFKALPVGVIVAGDELCRIARDDAIGGNVLGDDGMGRNDGALADRDPLGDHRAKSDPDTVADIDRGRDHVIPCLEGAQPVGLLADTPVVGIVVAQGPVQ